MRVANLERKLIWPDTKYLPPDLLVSIGTSCNAAISKQVNSSQSRVLDPSAFYKTQPFKGKEYQSNSQVKQVFKILKSRIDNILDTEVAWRTFISDVVSESEEVRFRYQRINPEIGIEVPKLDEVSKMQDFRHIVNQKLLHDQTTLSKIKEIAFRLVASSFFFEQILFQQNVGKYEAFCSGRNLFYKSET